MMQPQTFDLHIDDLCAKHAIRRVGGRGRAVVIRVSHRDGRRERRLEIRVPPVRGQVSYFVALHEIGHLVGVGRGGRRLESEEAAWRFALSTALVAPTDATRRRIGKRLRSYVTWAEIRARRRQPPFVPPPDAPFWRLLAWLEHEFLGPERPAGLPAGQADHSVGTGTGLRPLPTGAVRVEGLGPRYELAGKGDVSPLRSPHLNAPIP